MAKILSVFTADKFLFQKIALDCPNGVIAVYRQPKEFDIAIVDIDTEDSLVEGAVTMSRYREADLSLPFALGTLSRLFDNGAKSLLRLSASNRCAYLRSEEIKLTDIEFALLKLLIERKGEFVSREEILDKIWNNDAEGGVINVYIHYLREKLEKHGEKIIISSRKCGYSVDNRYIGG